MHQQRLTITLLLLMTIASPLHAQNQSQAGFLCDDGSRYARAFTVNVRDADPNAMTTLTAIGVGAFDPVLRVNTSDFFFCNDDASDPIRYAVDVPGADTVAQNTVASQVTMSAYSNFTLGIAEFDGNAGQALLIIDASGTTAFDITLTEAMQTADNPLSAYTFAANVGVNPPMLTLHDDAGNVLLTGEADADATLQRDAETLTEANSLQYAVDSDLSLDADLNLALDNETVSLRVTSPDAGRYVLVLRLSNGQAIPGDGVAQLRNGNDANNDDDVGLQLLCDGQVLTSGLLDFVLPASADDATRYTVTAVGQATFDPVLAVFDADNPQGVCYDDVPAAQGYSVNLPSVTADASLLSAQLTAQGGQRIVVGNFEGVSGGVVVLIEAALEPEAPQDVYTINGTAGLLRTPNLLNAYQIAAEASVNPYLQWLNPIEVPQDAEAFACDDAGIPDSCTDRGELLSDFTLTLASGRTVPGFIYDAMLTLPVDDRLLNAALQVAAGHSDATPTNADASTPDGFGAYVLVLHTFLSAF